MNDSTNVEHRRCEDCGESYDTDDLTMTCDRAVHCDGCARECIPCRREAR